MQDIFFLSMRSDHVSLYQGILSNAYSWVFLLRGGEWGFIALNPQ